MIKGIDFPLHADPAAYREAVAFIKADPLSLRRARHHAQDRPLQGLPRPLRRGRSARPPDGGDELPVQARRQARLPRQGPDLLRARARRLPARSVISSGPRRRAFLDRRRRLHHRADLAHDAARARRRPPLAHHRVEPQRRRGSTRSAASTARWRARVPVDYVLAPSAADNDAVVARLTPGSLVDQRDRARQGCAGLAPDRRRALPRGRHRLGPQLSRRPRLPRPGARAGGRAPTSRSRMAGPTSSMAGRRSSPRSSTIDIPTSGPRFDEISAIAARVSKG